MQKFYKELAKQRHLDFSKFAEENNKEVAEHFKVIIARFTDEEILDSIALAEAIHYRTEPERGLMYEEIADGLQLLGYNTRDLSDLQFEKIWGKIASKVDKLIYVGQTIGLYFSTSYTGSPITIFPVSRWTHKLENEDGTMMKLEESRLAVFNGSKQKYCSEEFFKLGIAENIKSIEKQEFIQFKSNVIDNRYKFLYGKTEEEYEKFWSLVNTILNMYDMALDAGKPFPTDMEIIEQIKYDLVGNAGSEPMSSEQCKALVKSLRNKMYDAIDCIALLRSPNMKELEKSLEIIATAKTKREEE